MMTRVQILLPEDQDRRLEALAARRRESKGKLIRRALDLLLRAEQADEDALLDLIGQAGRGRQSGASRDHDRILAAAERSRNRRR
jgi:Arc/MetJ-type ribon-helix-helix transcriptional regulator